MALNTWLYWEGDKPEWIKMCEGTVYDHSLNVNIISPADFNELWVKDKDIDISSLCVAHRADFIRAFLLAEFGGIWIDSDCVVMKSLSPLNDLLDKYEFFGYRERNGYITNNFMGTSVNSRVALAYYNNICNILRSGQNIEWLTLGSNTLTSTIESLDANWYELGTELIQPVCWSKPETFFITGEDKDHEKIFNRSSYCYMISANMVNNVLNQHSSEDIYNKKNFFNFLLRKSHGGNILSRIAFRKNTDDDKWVIPEIIIQDMYKITSALSALNSPEPEYIIDCGAHIGAFSVMCSRYLKNVEVISFEPNPDSFNYLSTNAERFGNIRAINKAVNIIEGVLDLYAPDEDEWNGRWSVLPNNNNHFTVEAINLFSFIKELDKPVFILKMDLEGYEEYILNNSCEEDFNGVKIIVIETHTGLLDHAKLQKFGYRLLFQPEISSHKQFVYTNIPAI